MRKITERRTKGELEMLQTGILAISVAVIVLVMSIIIIQEIRDTDIVANSESNSITNETIDPITGVAQNLLGASRPSASCEITRVLAHNSTGKFVVDITNTGNYSLSNENCAITFASANGDDIKEFNNTGWNITYGNTFGGEAYTAGNESIIGLDEFANLVPIIVTAIVAGIVLGIIFGIFGRRTRR